jgi:hypothetical protein
MHFVCKIEHALQIASGIFALAAAIVWLRASLTKGAPDFTTNSVVAQGGLTSLFDGLLRAVAKQSRLNAIAALLAALAAFCAFPQAFMPTCWSGMPYVDRSGILSN